MYKVIGDGMIAKAFNGLENKMQNCVIFASGVSDSRCKDESQFNREFNLLTSEIKLYKNSRFIYFGTCSVQDPDARSSLYVKHKLRMEEIVLSYSGGLVYRLPHVAGPNAPSTTILSAISRAAKNKTKFTVWTKARRNIIDIHDVRNIILKAISSDVIKARIVNIANKKSYSVQDIVKAFEETYGINMDIDYTHKGTDYLIEIEDVIPILKDLKIDFKNYLKRIIFKYYM
tara:strand:+ start:282 stop:971 length:690 start_codon:yes stop_codon:yes gene_type:complete